MEKQGFREGVPEVHSLRRSRLSSTRWQKPLYALGTLWLLSCALGFKNWPSTGDIVTSPTNRDSNQDPTSAFSWDSLRASKDLKYETCYGVFQCARLELPMDYWNGTTNATIGLAVVKKPAVVPVTDPRYGGAVLSNPGGPGGGGVDFLVARADQMRDTIEPDFTAIEQAGDTLGEHDAKFFDLISFDPRGVGLSEPVVQCFNNAMLDRAWRMKVMDEGIFGSSNAAFGRLWSMSVARGQSCSLPTDEPDIKQFVTTASVARDMVEITEAHGRWRESEVKRLISEKVRKAAAKGIQFSIYMPEHLLYQSGREKLQYWGFSYGSYLGTTFAAMFPERVQRVIVDGVVDAYDYRKALWRDNLVDTEKDMQQFYYHCARAGWPACALANKTGSTTEEGVESRVASIIDSLFHNPLPVIGDFPEVVEYSDVRNVLFAALYTPIQAFPFIANILEGIERGDGTALANLLRSYHQVSCRAQSGSIVQAGPLRNNSNTFANVDVGVVIACSDGDDRSGISKDTFNKFWHKLREISPTIGPMWATIPMHCINYSVRPQHRFVGPWTANTSHPIMLIGNTADPVTPVVNARTMSKGFPGSVVLTQNSAGHCSISAPSACTEGHIRRYFQTGELPEVGTTCEVDELPFGGDNNDEDMMMMERKKRSRGISASIFKASTAWMGSELGLHAAEAWFGEDL